MSIEVKIPPLPESVSDATLTTWHKQPGERIYRDDNLADLETDKVVLELPAPDNGVLEEILVPAGSTVTAGQVIARLGNAPPDSHPTDLPAPETSPAWTADPAQPPMPAGPAARRLMNEHHLNPEQIAGTGRHGRILKEDVLAHLAAPSTPPPSPVTRPGLAPEDTVKAIHEPVERSEQRTPMTRLRARIAERLLAAQHNSAMLTTFNEVDMKAIMELRSRYREEFTKTYGIRLGFMSFFIMATVLALRKFPVLNASIDGPDVVYHNYFDIGIAVSTPRGLVVPILRDADRLMAAQIEQQIAGFAERARHQTLTIEEITGGTFTITNGGVFGSLLSTPIINPPQSAILAMHKIQDRAVVIDGEITVRPMMYIALTYDHRIIDGQEAVQFLTTIKSELEDPTGILLGL